MTAAHLPQIEENEWQLVALQLQDAAERTYARRWRDGFWGRRPRAEERKRVVDELLVSTRRALYSCEVNGVEPNKTQLRNHLRLAVRGKDEVGSIWVALLIEIVIRLVMAWWKNRT